jgi:two-component system, chemotaxis family, protein-glutamate methylesterase/glutaminase
MGAFNVAQDENTSVVWGMPGSAVKLSAVDKVLPLHKIADEVIAYCKEQK